MNARRKSLRNEHGLVMRNVDDENVLLYGEMGLRRNTKVDWEFGNVDER